MKAISEFGKDSTKPTRGASHQDRGRYKHWTGLRDWNTGLVFTHVVVG